MCWNCKQQQQLVIRSNHIIIVVYCLVNIEYLLLFDYDHSLLLNCYCYDYIVQQWTMYAISRAFGSAIHFYVLFIFTLFDFWTFCLPLNNNNNNNFFMARKKFENIPPCDIKSMTFRWARISFCGSHFWMRTLDEISVKDSSSYFHRTFCFNCLKESA